MIKKIFAIFLFPSFFLPLASFANDVEDLSKLLKTYTTMSGNFEQSLMDSKGEIIQESKGVFTVKKPGYFYWDTQEPFPQLLISDLKTIWLYDPDLEQVTIRPYKNSVDQSPALLLSGDVKKITEYYAVAKESITKESVSKSEEGSNSFTLKPLAKESTFVELRLVFTDSLLTSMVLIDTLQQMTTFQFSGLSINKAVSDSLFSFTPPDGIDVLVDD